MQLQKQLKDSQATDEFGQSLALALKNLLQNKDKTAFLIFLNGELGAGKTSLVRACLRALGVCGAIKSPTYTLLEPYDVEISNTSSSTHVLSGLKIAHLDLYRLQEPEELDYIGGRDLKDTYQLIFVEWPEKAQGFIANPDINIQLNHIDTGREVIVSSAVTQLMKTLNR